MESYLQQLLDANPERHMAKGMVFNGSDAVLFQATRSQEEGARAYESPELSMEAGILCCSQV